MLISIERTTKFLLDFGKLHGQFVEALSGKYTSMFTSNLSKNFMIYSSSNANCHCVQTSHLSKRLFIPLPAMIANSHGTAKRGEKRL